MDSYVAEDGLSFYVTEDGLSTYITEGPPPRFNSWGNSWRGSWGTSWGFVPPPPPGPNDLCNYVFNFPSRTLAFIDPVVGPYLNRQPGAFTQLNTYDLRQGGVNELNGYWAIITQIGDNTSFDASPYLAFAINQSNVQVTSAGLTGCFINNVDDGLLENIQVLSLFGPFLQRGILPP
jgi:hypothetical protein